MMSVNIASEDVPDYLRRRLEDPTLTLTVACINSPFNVTMSGEDSGINLLKARLDEDGIFAHKLKTGMPYHTPIMQAIAEEYIKMMGQLTPNASVMTKVPIISTVTGANILPELVSKAEYWVRNLVSPVRFADAIRSTLDKTSEVQLGMLRVKPVYDVIEIGPHGALRRPCMDVIGQTSRKTEIRYTSVLDRNKSSVVTLMKLVGTLFTYGYSVSILNANRFNENHTSKPSFFTDLPQYPFDRSQRYWHESRLSYDFRMREPVPRSVLGSRVRDWNPLEPRWRKIISTKELPWVQDHIVSGRCIFPATGMLVMAIEAVQLIVARSKAVRGFLIKTAEFKNPISLQSDADGESSVETITNLRSLRKPFEKDSKWFEVWISTQSERAWKECFRCTIQLQFEEVKRPFDGSEEHLHAEEAASMTYKQASEMCSRPLPARSFYKFCAERGITYGPTFSILDDIRYHDENTVVGTIAITSIDFDYEGFVHPAILDAACQLCWLAPTRGLLDTIPTEIPFRLQNTYVAASGWKRTQTSRIRVASSANIKAVTKGVEGQIVMLADDGTLLCQVGQLELAPVANDDTLVNHDRRLLHGIKWAPCLSMSTTTDIDTECKADTFSGDEQAEIEYNETLTRVLCLAMEEALHFLSEADVQCAPRHLQKYISWMRRAVKSGHAHLDTSDHSLNNELDTIEALRPTWAVYTEVARNLIGIIRGDIDPLQLIFSTDLVERFYTDIFQSMSGFGVS
jgi:acyl transferase domain-containing protein